MIEKFSILLTDKLYLNLLFVSGFSQEFSYKKLRNWLMKKYIPHGSFNEKSDMEKS